MNAFSKLPRETTQSWIVLRCAGGSTLKLTDSLRDEGYDVWTPVEMVKRKPAPVFPSKLQAARASELSAEALMSSYVFARAQHLGDLLALARSPSLTYLVWDAEQRRMVMRGHPTFSVMRGPDTSWAVVSDAQLTPLRRIEYQRKPRGLVKGIPVGTKVRLKDGGFAGLDGVVQSVSGNKHAIVLFDGFQIPVQIAMWVLREALDAATDSGVSRYPTEQAA